MIELKLIDLNPALEEEVENYLEIETFFEKDGKEIVVIADVYLENLKDTWYEDERGFTQSQMKINRVDSNVLEVYCDIDGEITNTFTKKELTDLETMINEEVSKW